MSTDGPFVVGLVGRAGSGKSTVARALAAAGAEVIEADTIGHEVTDTDPAVRAALAAEYGPGAYRPDGTLDRPRVAARVFSDPEARARLDRLVHPRIVERIHARLAALREGGFRGVVVVDAALMLDWGLERACDVVLAVVAPGPDQVARLMRLRGWSEDETRRRLGVQRTNEQFRAAADQVLENHGSREQLERAARDAYARWMRAAAARVKGNGC
ncbi:MAG: dephospho-CoA kinase [Candidatus Eisenbacteria bacterium]|nr:dephospho-CoA kinase [Candidatus Eisenbacteria bacterium]